MLDTFLGHYAYWGAIALLGAGLYTVTASTNLVKKVMGLSIFQTAVFVLYIAVSAVEGATAPIVDSSHETYANPLPHVLILTAIVVGVATAALALALVVRIHAACDSVEEDDIARALLATGPVEAWIGNDDRRAGGIDGGDGDEGRTGGGEPGLDRRLAAGGEGVGETAGKVASEIDGEDARDAAALPEARTR